MSKDKKVDKKFNLDKKKLIIGGCVLAAIIIIAVVVLCCKGGKKGNEKELTSNLEKLGGQFYEKFYYPSQEKSQSDVKEFIARFKDTGIKVNLENISKVSSVDKKLVEGMVNSKTDKKCDAKESYVVIKPVDPYGKKDYKIEATLKCGFDSEKEAKKVETKKEAK